MTVRILKGDCRDVLATLPDESVHCVVTSPPYWGLRDYGTAKWEGGKAGCDHVGKRSVGASTLKNDGRPNPGILENHKVPSVPYRDVCLDCGARRIDSQIGLEPSFSAYVETMRAVFAEVRRVLRKDGTLFLNLGDSYFSGAQRADVYDKRGKEPASSQARDCFCQSLCGACRAAYRIGKSHSEHLPASMPFVSTQASSRDHRKPLLDRPPMSGSIRPDDHNVTAILDRQPLPSHVDEQPHAFQESTSLGCARQPHDLRSEVSTRDGECRVCGRSLADCVPASAHMTDCTCGTGDDGSVGRMTGKGASGLAYPEYTIEFLKPKDLCGIPWRVAFALQQDGWYLRSDIIWSKINPMPESVTDRPTKAHEYLFLMSKSQRYYYDCDAIREITGKEMSWEERSEGAKAWKTGNLTEGNLKPGDDKSHPNGRNRRSVWEIATAPFAEAHFATFPPALVEPCIKAGTSEKGCCAKCGAPWVRDSNISYENLRESGSGTGFSYGNDGRASPNRLPLKKKTVETIGFSPSCSCRLTENSRDEKGWPFPTRPCTILDPFGGAGTTGLVADRLGRNAILIELNPQYAEMAERRLRNDAGMFAMVAAE